MKDIRLRYLEHNKNNKSFSVIEVIVAVALFVIIAVTGISTMLQSFTGSRLGEEETAASIIAAEGIDAVKSIRNQGWANLTTGLHGLSYAGNKWSFSGITDTFGKYTRQISISQVNRDVSGNIVTSGGILDPDTLKADISVDWNFSTSRTGNNISLSTYLTNFRKSGVGDGILFYSENTTNPVWRTYSDSADTFSSENTSVVGANGRNFIIRTSPVKEEAIGGYVSSAGMLYVYCFSGGTWIQEWMQSVGGNGSNSQRFNIGYEKTTGDVLVVYSNNEASGSNELAYRTKPGSTGCGSANWSSHTTYDALRTSGVVHWIIMKSSPVSGSNNVAVIWADSNSDLSGIQWTGSSFGVSEPATVLETNLERVAISQDVQSFDLSYESQTGNLIVVWGLYQASGCTAGTTIATTNCIRYSRYTSSWSSVAVIPTVADPATNIDISSNPDTNELILASLDNNQADLSIAYWSGSAWTGRANHDTSTRVAAAGRMLVSTGWLINGSTTRKIIVYNDQNATNVGWVVCTTGVTCITQTDWIPTPLFANPQSWYNIQTNPKSKDRLQLTISDNLSDLYSKRLVMTATPGFTWSNSDGSVALETTLGFSSSNPFSFAFWQN